MKTILVPLDFSDATEPILRAVRELASSETRVVLLHVEPPEPDFVGYDPGPQHVRDNVAHEARENHQRLHAAQKALQADGLEAEVLLIQGPTVEKILNEAERLDAGMIVVGSHGHGALFDLLVGSVSEGVIRKSRCPVMVVPRVGRA